MKLNREVKGFTLLELLVVLAIVAIISAVGYPNFLSWSKDREVRQATEKLSSSITTINTYTQRGTYPFTQLLIEPGTSGVVFTIKGKDKQSLSNLINAGTAITCDTADATFWSNNQIKSYDLADVYVHFDNGSAICFSKNADNYLETGDILGQDAVLDDSNVEVDNYIIICGSDSDCDTDPQRPAYMVVWSQFGNVSRFKYSGDDWVRQ